MASGMKFWWAPEEAEDVFPLVGWKPLSVQATYPFGLNSGGSIQFVFEETKQTEWLEVVEAYQYIRHFAGKIWVRMGAWTDGKGIVLSRCVRGIPDSEVVGLLRDVDKIQ